MPVTVPRYFDLLIEGFWSGRVGRNVHLGYWDVPPSMAAPCSSREFETAQARLTEILIQMADLDDSQSVLDVGCGFGGTLEAVGKRPRMRRAGINVDRRQLDICRTLPATANSLWLVLADACALPFRAASFDRVLCVEAMFHYLDVNPLALGHAGAAIPAAASTGAAPNAAPVSIGEVRITGQSPQPVAITSGGAATAAAAATSEVDGGLAAATNAVAREIVSPDDVIRAIKSGEIAIRHTDGAAEPNSLAGQVWLFDEADGSFVPPGAEQLTIVVERDNGQAPLPVQSAEALGLVATTAMVAAEPTWLGALRQFGRKAVLVVQQGARWMH